MLSANWTEEILKNHNKTDGATNKQFQFLLYHSNTVDYKSSNSIRQVIINLSWNICFDCNSKMTLRFKNLLLALIYNCHCYNKQERNFEYTICKESKEPHLVWSILKQRKYSENILGLERPQNWKKIMAENDSGPKIYQGWKFYRAENDSRWNCSSPNVSIKHAR